MRLTDGTHETEIETNGDATLHQAEAAAHRLLLRLRTPAGEPPTDTPSFGFTRDLDGTRLDATAERAEPYPERPDPYDD